jgi:iron complex transport system substrate-binding protein
LNRRAFRIFALVLFLAGGAAAHAQPSRIVSTSPSITETLFALGLGDRVVGVSSYGRYPPAVRLLPKIGTYNDPDPEKIALLRPDLVIIHTSFPALAGRLSALGIHHAEIQVDSLDSVYKMIDDIGAAAGVPVRAAALNGRIRSRLDALRQAAAGEKKPSVLVLVGRNPGLLTGLVAVGSGAYLGELLEIAGGRNVLSKTLMDYPRISLETVVRLNPDVIIDASFMGDADEDQHKQNQMLRRPWLDHRELTAVRNGKVAGLSSEALVTPGPRVVEAVEMMRAAIKGSPDSR